MVNMAHHVVHFHLPGAIGLFASWDSRAGPMVVRPTLDRRRVPGHIRAIAAGDFSAADTPGSATKLAHPDVREVGTTLAGRCLCEVVKASRPIFGRRPDLQRPAWRRNAHCLTTWVFKRRLSVFIVLVLVFNEAARPA